MKTRAQIEKRIKEIEKEDDPELGMDEALQYELMTLQWILEPEPKKKSKVKTKST